MVNKKKICHECQNYGKKNINFYGRVKNVFCSCEIGLKKFKEYALSLKFKPDER